MAEIVNLRLQRKRKAREEGGRREEQNRSRFGESKADRQARDAERAQLNKRLDGHRLPPTAPIDDGVSDRRKISFDFKGLLAGADSIPQCVESISQLR